MKAEVDGVLLGVVGFGWRFECAADVGVYGEKAEVDGKAVGELVEHFHKEVAHGLYGFFVIFVADGILAVCFKTYSLRL